jgi:hypothetical protein
MGLGLGADLGGCAWYSAGAASLGADRPYYHTVNTVPINNMQPTPFAGPMSRFIGRQARPGRCAGTSAPARPEELQVFRVFALGVDSYHAKSSTKVFHLLSPYAHIRYIEARYFA